MSSEISYRFFDDGNLDEVLDLARSRFEVTDLPRLPHALRNPARRPGGPAGCVAYCGERVVCFMAQFPHPLHFGTDRLVSSAAMGFLCKARHAFPKEQVTEFLRFAQSGADGYALYVGNTAIYASMLQFHKLGASAGPETWMRTRVALIRPLAFAAFVLSRKLFKRKNVASNRPLAVMVADGPTHHVGAGFEVRRLPEFDARYERFWQEYLATCRGLVASRTRAELEWAFGEGLGKGESALLGLFHGERLEGYAVIVPMANSGRRWLLKDLVVLENAPERIERMLRGLRLFLRRETQALTLEAIGFPTWTEAIFRRQLPLVRRGGHNPYVLLTPDAQLRAEVLAADAPGNWFFGPYDGDSYLLRE